MRGYTASYADPQVLEDGSLVLDITNTHKPGQPSTPVTDVRVSKTWNDNDDAAGKRPASVTIRLIADGVDTGKSIKLTEANGWKGVFSNLNEYKGGHKIVYTITEDAVEGYETVVRGYEVVNTYKPEEPGPGPEPTPDPGIDEDEDHDEGNLPHSGSEADGKTPHSPYTGDNRHTAVWALAAILALAGALLLGRKRRDE